MSQDSNYLQEMPNDLRDLIYKMKYQLELDDHKSTMKPIFKQLNCRFSHLIPYDLPVFTSMNTFLTSCECCRPEPANKAIHEDFAEYWEPFLFLLEESEGETDEEEEEDEDEESDSDVESVNSFDEAEQLRLWPLQSPEEYHAEQMRLYGYVYHSDDEDFCPECAALNSSVVANSLSS